MKQEQLERLAAKNAPIPDGLDVPQQYLFLSLRSLYALYHTGGIGKEQAKREKTCILEQYKDFDLKWRIAQQHMGMLRAVQKYSDRIKDSGCGTCKALFRVLCGLPDEERSD